MSQLPEAVTPFDPSNVETRTELAAALDALRLRCGLSYEQMERAAGRLPPGSGRLARSTIGDIVRAKTLPQRETFRAFLRVCNVPSGDVPGWLAAWERAATADLPRPASAIRIRDADPRRLGVHASIVVDERDDDLPRYVARDRDDTVRAMLDEAASGGGFVLLVGGSSVGKTRMLLSTLFEHRVVDLPHAAALVTAAADRQASLSETVMMTLARRATWTTLEDQGTALLVTLANHPDVQADSHSLASLVYACASGWAAAFSPTDVVIAKLLTVILAYGVGVTTEAARTVVPAAQKIAAAYEADFMPHLRTFLVGVLTDPTDQFHMTTEVATRTVRDALGDYE